MIPNALNTVVGLVLIYYIVLASRATGDPLLTLAVAGGVIAALAFWAYRGDRVKWFNLLNLLLGIALLAVAV